MKNFWVRAKISKYFCIHTENIQMVMRFVTDLEWTENCPINLGLKEIIGLKKIIKKFPQYNTHGNSSQNSEPNFFSAQI